MIAVTGATGHLGRLVIKSLSKKVASSEIVALVRDPAKASDLGVAARQADYTDPASLDAALAGVDKLLLISSNDVGQRATQHQNVIDAAKRAGVQLVVYTSLLHAPTSSLNLADEHRQTEDALKASGLAHVILRNGWYTENYTGSIGGALAGGAFIGSAGDGRISSAARADYAEAAAIVLTTPDQAGRTYELAGDTAWTLSDLAAEVSRQTGKPLPYKDLPGADYAAALTGFGLPEPLAQSIAGWDVEASKGALYDDSGQLSRLIGHATTPLSVTVGEALKTAATH